VDGKSYSDLCVQELPYPVSSDTVHTCKIVCILQLWGFNRTLIENTASIPAYISSIYIPGYRQVLNYSALIGGREDTDGQTIASAEAFLVYMPLQKSSYVQAWQAEFINVVDENLNLFETGVKVFKASESSILSEFRRTTQAIVPLLALSFVSMFAYVSFQFYRKKKPVDKYRVSSDGDEIQSVRQKHGRCGAYACAPDSKMVVGIICVFMILPSTVAGLGLSLLFGVFLTPISYLGMYICVSFVLTHLFIGFSFRNVFAI